MLLDVDSKGKKTSFIELSGEALRFHKPGKLLKLLCYCNEEINIFVLTSYI